ncbi:hypothetical protein RJT34_04797 [Clitoria ternatea]|uniref:Endoplasmic reticulum transmembrane protein n=1 Tax=Clitoria ternatea TaxID=43366 RepID=A0AAN9KMA3_CLITE
MAYTFLVLQYGAIGKGKIPTFHHSKLLQEELYMCSGIHLRVIKQERENRREEAKHSLCCDRRKNHSFHIGSGDLMALEWVVLGYAAGAEAVMVLLLTIPGLDALRKGLVTVTRNLLKPFMSVVPFCLFLLMDIYWKYENRPSCEGDSCTPSEHLRHQKSIMKSQRNALLIAAALLFYWLLYSVTNLIVRIEQLNQRLERLKNRD